MITRMTKYTFLLLSSTSEEFLGSLQDLGVIDISRSQKPVDSKSAELFNQAESLRKEIAVIEECNYSKDSRHCEIAEAIAAAGREKAEKERWGDTSAKSEASLLQAGWKVRYFCVPRKKYNPDWESICPMEVIDSDAREVRFVTVEPVSGSCIPAPETVVSEKTLDGIKAEIAALTASLVERENQMQLRRTEVPALRERCAVLTEQLQRHLAKSASESAAEGYVNVMTGFAPADEDARLAAELDKLDCIWTAEPAKAEDNPPIKLKNNWFARNFETLTEMYGMPVYDEFDPTPILAPFFLLFWAFCMGDAGYGLLLILIGILLKRGLDILGLHKHWRLVTTLGVGATVIGLVLGTFFGINLSEVSWIPEGLRKCMLVGKLELAGSSYDVSMVAAIAVGIFHICLAMVVKGIGLTKRFGFKNAVSTWGWIVLIVGGLVVAGLALTNVLDATATKIAVIAIGVLSFLGIFIFNRPGRNPLLNIGAGLWDTYGMATGLLGDVLSYVRLYALGLAGGLLGSAFNDLARMTLSDGVNTWQWLFFILIALLGHALNFAMSCLGAFVHPLRLTFVEYFKNSGYEGKGAGFNPLKKEMDNKTINN